VTISVSFPVRSYFFLEHLAECREPASPQRRQQVLVRNRSVADRPEFLPQVDRGEARTECRRLLDTGGQQLEARAQTFFADPAVQSAARIARAHPQSGKSARPACQFAHLLKARIPRSVVDNGDALA